MTILCKVSWTRKEEKAFENAIALCYLEEQSNQQWDKVASMVPSKTIDELKQHYQKLMEDVSAIEAGQIPLPSYGNIEEDTSSSSSLKQKGGGCGGGSPKDQRDNSNQGNGCSGLGHGSTGSGGRESKLDQERKKGIPWTEEEHRLFLLGLDKFGKGDWRSISRKFVLTRTPTQVASHAQKYFIRLNSINRDRRRSSIHDITSVNNGAGSGLPHHEPITGTQHATSPTIHAQHRPQPNLGLYGTQMGHPVELQGHMTVSAFGTSVMLPPPGHPPTHYAVPLAYPMLPRPPVHRR